MTPILQMSAACPLYPYLIWRYFEEETSYFAVLAVPLLNFIFSELSDYLLMNEESRLLTYVRLSSSLSINSRISGAI